MQTETESSKRLPRRVRKADINHQACTTCQARGKACTYSHSVGAIVKQTARKPRGPASSVHKPIPTLVSPPFSVTSFEAQTETVTRTSAIVDSTPNPFHVDKYPQAEADLGQDRAYYTAHGRFAGQVAAAIDLKAGFTPATCHQVPLSLPWQFKDKNKAPYIRETSRDIAFFGAHGPCFQPRLELVQCLMLMNRYLHCTINQPKTWMTAGLAMRIAQSMCCHIAEAPLSKGSTDDKGLKQKVWASCVALDRRSQQLGQNPMHDNWGLGLHEIGNQIQLAQIQTRTSLAARFRPPFLSQQAEYHNSALQLDASLQNWENSLPSDWQLQNLRMVADRSSRAERYVLHLRPMLARFYAMKPETHPSPKSPNLSHRLLRESANMCIEAAQQVALLVQETLEPDEPIGLLPWWYRIYYLHIAGATFLAAMFRSGLFTDSVSQSWKGVLLALRAHEHLSLYIQQCVCTFETLAARITGKSYPSLDVGSCGLIVDESAGVCFDNIFKGVNFDYENFIFGPEDCGEGLV
ncbi:hypothetical protein N7463_008970 [Penicillium fimorum]|uniref:Xylanolytic transcriptional activator regulatory domain-containing protein n=1 Tax=Penicillium fimorum TaxID=1882269 RepID=A0A9W9XPV6_9EURO|nr:hypothetical protein N7463_008970 [Penicillium fimorum]